MHNEHLILAGKYSRAAHNNWLIAMRESTSDDVRADAMRKGDAAMAQADNHLRKYGVGMDRITDDEREMLLTDECFNSSNVSNADTSSDKSGDETEIDFRLLKRAVLVSEGIKFFNRAALAALIFGFAYLFGYGEGRDAGPHTTGEQIQQQLEQHKGENHGE